MVMRVGGIVSGMDIEAMVNKLMEAERTPLTKMKQQQTTLEWKRDAFREINSALLELDNIVRDMKYTRAYNSKSTTSALNNVATATAGTAATNGTYNIDVKSLATSEMQVFSAQADTVFENDGQFTFNTYDNKGTPVEHTVDVKAGDTLKAVLKNMESASDGKVRAFLDETSNKVVLETTRTGIYNESGPEIVFKDEDNIFLSKVTKIDEQGQVASNAQFIYNGGLTIDSRDNNYSLNGITFNLHSVGQTNITVRTDVDAAFDNIVKFVDKYNGVIEKMNTSQTEEKFRSYQPLTEEQKKEMSEEQIKQWEEKAKSGILKGESSLRDGMFTLRSSLQGVVDNDGPFKLLSDLGITTTKNYLDGGKLEIDEEKLRSALETDADGVYQLFVGDGEGKTKGLIHRFDEALDSTRAKIEEKAGKATHTLDNYAIGKQMKDLNARIADFEKRMVRVEERYWSQFTAMEKAISNLNQQSSYLFSQFGS